MKRFFSWLHDLVFGPTVDPVEFTSRPKPLDGLIAKGIIVDNVERKSK